VVGAVGTLEAGSQNVVGRAEVEVGNPHLFHRCTADDGVAAAAVVVGRSSCCTRSPDVAGPAV